MTIAQKNKLTTPVVASLKILWGSMMLDLAANAHGPMGMDFGVRTDGEHA